MWSCEPPAVLCGPKSHNRAKHTTPKQIVSVNMRNNKIYPSMTRAKSLLSNVTLLVRPGLEPKIARFGGLHGVSCGRGLNPRHGPLHTSLGSCNHRSLVCFLWSTNFEHSSSFHGLWCFDSQWLILPLAKIFMFSLIASHVRYWCIHYPLKFSRPANLFFIVTWYIDLFFGCNWLLFFNFPLI
jgi:hypothetical protein